MNTKSETMGIFTDGVGSELNSKPSSMRPGIFVALGLWLGSVIFLAARGAFVGPADSPPLPIFLGLALPLAVFFAAYSTWGAFRSFVLGADLRFVAGIQAWRWAGLGFINLYAKGILPGLFALPAGIGDMAIGFTAPWIVLALARNPLFAASRRYVTWNVLGILDLAVAVSMGVLSSGFLHGVAPLIGNVTTAPMAQLPLILIPAYMVPLFIMLHSTALFQARHLARSGKTAAA